MHNIPVNNNNNGQKKLFQIAEDFKIGFPSVDNNWNSFVHNWSNFTDILLNLRRGSVKDKYAQDLLSKLDAAQVRKGMIKC